MLPIPYMNVRKYGKEFLSSTKSQFTIYKFNLIMKEMKTKRLFVMAIAAAMVLASCSDGKEGNNGRPGDGEITYAGVNITLPAGTGTRADDVNAGIPAEKAVNTIGVYIVDITTGRLDSKVLTVASDFTLTTNAGSQAVYKAKTGVPTVTGTKKVYVVANPSEALQDELEASGGSVMNPVASDIDQSRLLNLSGAALSSMVMSGAYTGTGGELDMTAAQDETTALNNPIDITIGRNMAKAVVQESETYEVDGGTTTLTWTLINKAVDSYFIPQSAGTLYREVPDAALAVTGGDTHFYWANFSGMTGTDSDSDYIGVLPYGTGDAKTAAYADSKYMLENYPVALHEGNTTAVRIKGTFVPDEIFDSIDGDDPVPTTITSGTTFYRSTIDGSYWTAAGAVAAVEAGYEGHLNLQEFSVYTNGVGYYTIWVNDGQGNKGVKRNSYYLMQINEVRGPGSPTEPTDPRPPIADDTNLGVNITVLNWDYNKSVQDIQ